jgi:hypothetical protein
LNPNGLWMGSLRSLHFFAWTVLSLSWRHKSYLPSWLSSTHWSGGVIWTRPFQFDNLVTATYCNLHLRQCLKVVGWPCLLARSPQVCSAHSFRRHRFYGGYCLKVLTTSNRSKQLVRLNLIRSESGSWWLRDRNLGNRPFGGEFLVWDHVVIRFDPSWQVRGWLIVGNLLGHSLCLWKLANKIGGRRACKETWGKLLRNLIWCEKLVPQNFIECRSSRRIFW